jgi:hypothetical protein
MTGMSVTDPRREELCGGCRRAVDSGGYRKTRSRGVIDGSEGFRRSGTAERSRYLDPVMRIVKSSRVNKPGGRSDDDGDDEEDRQVARAGGRQQRYVCVCVVCMWVLCVCACV